jgi:hypothetical protein
MTENHYEICSYCEGSGYDEEGECPNCLSRCVVPTLEALVLIDRLRAENKGLILLREELRAEVTHYEMTSGELCEKCGWRGIRPPDKCAFCEMYDGEKKSERLKKINNLSRYAAEQVVRKPKEAQLIFEKIHKLSGDQDRRIF